MLKKICFCAVPVLALCAVLAVQAEDKKKNPLAGIKCPVSGKAVVKNGVAKHNGGTVYFCCTNCPKAFANNTKKFAAKANHQMVATGQFKEEKCPLTGRKLNPNTKVKISGVKVAFCCNNCKGKVEKAEGEAQINLVFNDKAFKKGFTAKKKDKK